MSVRTLVAFFMLSACAFAQGGFYQDRAEGRLINGNALVAIPGATVTVCSDSLCASPVNIYSNADLAIGHLIGTSTTADVNGNFSFYILPGQYFCQVGAPGFSTATNPCQVSLTLPILSGATTLNFTNAGIFTNTQMNTPASYAVGGINFQSEYQAAQGNNASTEGFAAGVAVPNSSTVHQADGIAGYVTNSSTSTNAVGVYSQARCLVNGTTCWGANFVSRDVGGLTTGITLYGNEIDVNPLNATTAYNGVNGFLMNLNTTQTGTYLGNGGFYVTASAGARWFVGYQTNDDAAATAAIFGATCTSGSCASQPIKVRSLSSGVAKTGSASATLTADRTWTLPDNTGTFTLQVATGSATVDLASVASAACTADSSDVTLTGAAVGDPVRVTAATALPAGVWLIGRVTATNTGRFQLCNLSGGAVDRASDTYTISVVK